MEEHHSPQAQQEAPAHGLEEAHAPNGAEPKVEHHAPLGKDEVVIEQHVEDKKTGRRKINIEFIEDKGRRHITFSKRKAGIMKKAYELSTLTGTQVLLLVASETGHVYTFATPKLQPLITKPEGKNLIQACLNTPETPAQPPALPPAPAPHHQAIVPAYAQQQGYPTEAAHYDDKDPRRYYRPEGSPHLIDTSNPYAMHGMPTPPANYSPYPQMPLQHLQNMYGIRHAPNGTTASAVYANASPTGYGTPNAPSSYGAAPSTASSAGYPYPPQYANGPYAAYQQAGVMTNADNKGIHEHELAGDSLHREGEEKPQHST